jgi:chromate transporter
MVSTPPPAGTNEDASTPAPAIPPQSLAAVFLRFLRFGALAWGGPIAQIAMLQRELVVEQRWVSPERFRRALAVYQVLPGPEAHELCVWFGMLARGRSGAVLAGLGFMLPGFLLMLGLSALYVNGLLHDARWLPLLAGAQAAVIAVIVRALFRIGQHTLHDALLAAIAAGACAGTLLGVHFTIALVLAGLVHSLAHAPRRWLAYLTVAAFIVCVVIAASTGDAAPIAQPPTAGPPAMPRLPTNGELFVSGLRGGALTFGGAYTAIPFLQDDAVATGGWMTNEQFLDCIAFSGTLPAPLIIFATGVGYVGGGLFGALAMTAGIFLPAFSFTLLGHGFFERVTGNASTRRFLDGVTAAVVGIMVATTVGLAQAALPDLRRAALAAAVLPIVWWWKSRAATPVAVMLGAAGGWLLLAR